MSIEEDLEALEVPDDEESAEVTTVEEGEVLSEEDLVDEEVPMPPPPPVAAPAQQVQPPPAQSVEALNAQMETTLDIINLVGTLQDIHRDMARLMARQRDTIKTLGEVMNGGGLMPGARPARVAKDDLDQILSGLPTQIRAALTPHTVASPRSGAQAARRPQGEPPRRPSDLIEEE